MRTQLVLFFGVPSTETSEHEFGPLVLDAAICAACLPENKLQRKAILSAALLPDVTRSLRAIEQLWTFISSGINRTVHIYALEAPEGTSHPVIISRANALPKHLKNLDQELSPTEGIVAGAANVAIPRTGKVHTELGIFDKTIPEDSETMLLLQALVQETIENWQTHKMWKHSRSYLDRNHYFTLRRAFTPENTGENGPLFYQFVFDHHETSEDNVMNDFAKEILKEWFIENHTEDQDDQEPVVATVVKDLPGSGLHANARKDSRKLLTGENQAIGGSLLHISGQEGCGKRSLLRYLLMNCLDIAHPIKKRNSVPRTCIQRPATPWTGKPVILSYFSQKAGYNPQLTTTFSMKQSQIMIAFIAQFLVQDTTYAHHLNQLAANIGRSKNIHCNEWPGWSNEDLWLIFDAMLASRSPRDIIIFIEAQNQLEEEPRGWFVQRLIDRIASGGPEGDGRIHLILSTTSTTSLNLLPSLQARGYEYRLVRLDDEGHQIQLSRNSAFSSYLRQSWVAYYNNEESPCTEHIGRILSAKDIMWHDVNLIRALRPNKVGFNFIHALRKNSGAHAVIDHNFRETLYNSHFQYTMERLARNKNARKWAIMALGWLLHTPAPMRVEALAMGIALWDQCSRSLTSGSVPCEYKSTHLSQSSEFWSILHMLRKALGNSVFVQLRPSAIEFDEMKAGYVNTGPEFIELRHTEVKHYLLNSLDPSSYLVIPDGNGRDTSFPYFKAAAEWHECIALTCLKALFMIGGISRSIFDECNAQAYHRQIEASRKESSDSLFLVHQRYSHPRSSNQSKQGLTEKSSDVTWTYIRRRWH